MIAPDHWVPLTVVSKKLNYSGKKIYTSAAMLGMLHALTSEAIAGLSLLIGMFLVKSYIRYMEIASVLLLIVVGISFIVNGYTEEEPESGYSVASIKSILAVSAFPDFALIPIMLACSALDAVSILWILVAFITISSISLTIMVYGSSKGLSKTLEKVQPGYIDYIMGLILFVTAGIIAFAPI